MFGFVSSDTGGFGRLSLAKINVQYCMMIEVTRLGRGAVPLRSRVGVTRFRRRHRANR